MSSNPSVSLNSLLGTLTLMPHIHFLTGQVSLPCNITLHTQLLYNLPLIINDISLFVSNGTNCLNLFHPIRILASTAASASPSTQKNLKWVTWRDHATFGASLCASAGICYNEPVCTKSEVSMFTHYIYTIWKAMQNVETGVVWRARGHPRSLTMSPFDRVHITSYLTLIENMHLSCTVFEL